MQSTTRFRALHPTLDHVPFVVLRAHTPPQWTTAFHDGTANPTDEQCLPPGLLDHDGPRQQCAIKHARTLIERAVAPVCKLRMRHIYTAMTARVFSAPRTLNAQAGAAARHLHLFDDVPSGDERDRAIARAVRCVRHPAVPAEMSETAFNVLHSGFPFGPHKRSLCGRDTCPCGFGHAETVEHTFKECARSKRLWELLTSKWRETTGETKVTASHGRIVLLGDRSCTWATEAEEAEWAGLEEPWSVMHKVAQHVILEERNKDAAPRPGRRRSPAELYQKVQSVMQRIVNTRWRAAVVTRRHDAGKAIGRFRKLWEATGLVVIMSETVAQLVLLMREATRSRWRRPAPGVRAFRNQQHAPPGLPPADMVHVYISGDADTRKKGQPPPPAGYGAVATAGGRRVFEMAGQIVAQRTPNVRTTTQNLSDLVSFARAVRWATRHFVARDKPICIRYNSEYAARIATGTWKAKKHKAMAEEARQAWAQLKRTTGGRAWMRHVDHKDLHHSAASRLATAGKRGTFIYAEIAG